MRQQKIARKKGACLVIVRTDGRREAYYKSPVNTEVAIGDVTTIENLELFDEDGKLVTSWRPRHV